MPSRKEKGLLELTLKECLEKLAVNPRDAATLRRSGDTRRRLGQFAEALTDFNAALALEPRSTIGLAGRAAVWKGLKRPHDALVDFDQALALNSVNVAALIGRATARKEVGLGEQALEDLSMAIKLEPENASAWQLRGEIKRKLGDLSGAVRDFDKCLRVNPEYAAALAGRGAAKKGMGHHDSAIADYNKAVSLEPRNPAILSGRGVTYLDVGRLQSAREDFGMARRLLPHDAFAAWGFQEASDRINRGLLRVVTLKGFEYPGLNTQFIERKDPNAKVNGHETYWAADNEWFLFWCNKEERWKGAPAGKLPRVVDGQSSGIIGAPCGPESENLNCPAVMTGWHEWDGMTWKMRPTAGIRRIDRISEPRRCVTLGGFTAHALNCSYTEYTAAESKVGGQVTYWNADATFFLFWNEADGRWKLSRAEDFLKAKAGGKACVLGAPHGADLFSTGRCVGWHEWDGTAWQPRPDAGLVAVGVAIPQTSLGGPVKRGASAGGGSGQAAKRMAGMQQPAQAPPATPPGRGGKPAMVPRPPGSLATTPKSAPAAPEASGTPRKPPGFNTTSKAPSPVVAAGLAIPVAAAAASPLAAGVAAVDQAAAAAPDMAMPPPAKRARSLSATPGSRPPPWKQATAPMTPTDP
eukprot:TRINITY_DN4467_c0_g1_i1.p1 TRINITY_DN4467_c0_g1~~TRINITY_DN4467_c0_g1_i1.p1  ORF type:complete len:638 (+),score=128.32 TRINITY_DN4467_c0_g1_i1:102-2015(+)